MVLSSKNPAPLWAQSYWVPSVFTPRKTTVWPTWLMKRLPQIVMVKLPATGVHGPSLGGRVVGSAVVGGAVVGGAVVGGAVVGGAVVGGAVVVVECFLLVLART
jgi:hypothetical protein